MDHELDKMHDLLKRILLDASEKPTKLPVWFLESITDKFSENKKIGSGGFAEVYKGILGRNHIVAVKKLNQSHMIGLQEVKFLQEVDSLMRVKHKNMVRFLGYCSEAKGEMKDYEGKKVMADERQMFLCFEFLPEGSLDNHIKDASDGLEWKMRYQIIKGICEGLYYLHQLNIVHSDLKPANILLDYNMVPKIADFGLSRCFDENQSRTMTSKLFGSLGYLPPEFYRGEITFKLDIYSLGVIIIEILTGQKGYPPIDNVLKSWSNRLKKSQQADAQLEVTLEQVRVCREIGLECTNFDPVKRPTAASVTEMLYKMETLYGSPVTHDPMILQLPAETCSEVRVARIGLWGGVGGTGSLDIEVTPNRLESLRIGSSGEGICSLGFSYTDHRGQQHTAGPCGGNGPEKGGDYHMIHLGPSEHLRDVSGTIGSFFVVNSVIITSLTFTTNERAYGPYGEARGTPFQIPVLNSGSIVGFFARAGWYLDSLGIYVKPKQYVGIEEEEDVRVKIGPWGGNGGSPWDIEVEPKHLKSVIIYSGIVVESVEFSYIGQNGQKYSAGPWGDPSASNYCTIELGPSEFLTAVYGTTGPFSDAPSDVVTSLTFVSNAHVYGPFGRGGGVPFQIPMQGNGSILGFFGRASKFIDAIGVYANPKEEMQRKIGPWGGTGGIAHYIDGYLEPKPHRLESMKIHYDHVINSLEFSYSDHSGRQHFVGPWGRPGAKCLSFELNSSEYVQSVSGTFGQFSTSPNVITSLRFGTNLGQVHGPIGHAVGIPFSIRAEKDDRIVGFFGRAGSYLEAIGAYVHTD